MTVALQVWEIIKALVSKILSHMIFTLISTVVLPARKYWVRTSRPALKSTGIQKTYVLEQLTIIELWVLFGPNIFPFWKLLFSPSHYTHGWQVQHGAGWGAAAPRSTISVPSPVLQQRMQPSLGRERDQPIASARVRRRRHRAFFFAPLSPSLSFLWDEKIGHQFSGNRDWPGSAVSFVCLVAARHFPDHWQPSLTVFPGCIKRTLCLLEALAHTLPSMWEKEMFPLFMT